MSMTDQFKKFTTYIGVSNEEKDESEDELQQIKEELCGWCPTLTYKQRLYGFGICFVAGWFISFLSVLAVPSIKSNPGKKKTKK